MSAICPGCGRLAEWAPDACEHCEYPDLAAGRYHYCGQDWCHCRNLRRTMRREVLEAFAVRNAKVLAEVGVNGWNDMDPDERARRMQGVWPVEEETHG